jgi:murein DD-endopeptidase MepM/ murein hydrolase activator NlpD
MAMPIGTDVFAANTGTVTVGYDAGGFGYFVVITGNSGIVTKYAHLDSVLVSNGDIITMGDIIAKSGNSGGSTGAHLHFEIIRDGIYFNPLFFAEAGVFN